MTATAFDDDPDETLRQLEREMFGGMDPEQYVQKLERELRRGRRD